MSRPFSVEACDFSGWATRDVYKRQVLTQLGVGPEEGFRIEDASKTWSEFLYDDPRLEFAKTFIYLKVRLAFDPPLSSAVIEAINRQISELEWRINVTVDPD